MTHNVRPCCLVLAACVTGLALAMGACTSSSSTSANGATDQTFCSALKTYDQACPSVVVSAACFEAGLQQLSDDCTQIALSYSDAFKNAVTSCAPAASCPYGDPYLTPCFQTAISTLTPAQQQLAATYCAACPGVGQTVSACEATFWGLPDSGVPGPGGQALQYSDAVVQRIQSDCASQLDAGLAACLTFGVCEATTIAQMLPPAPAGCPLGVVDAGGAADAAGGG
jgi:hypothetical protein